MFTPAAKACGASAPGGRKQRVRAARAPARQVLPRPLLDAALAARRAEREEGTREWREQLKHCYGAHAARDEGGGGHAQHGGGGAGVGAVAGPGAAPVAVALFPEARPGAAHATRRADAPPPPPLPRPFLSVPGGLPVGTLRAWLMEQLAGEVAADAEQQAAQQGAQQQQQSDNGQQSGRQQTSQQQQQQQHPQHHNGSHPGAGASAPALGRLQLLVRGRPLHSMSESVGRLHARAWAGGGKGQHGKRYAQKGPAAGEEPVMIITYSLLA